MLICLQKISNLEARWVFNMEETLILKEYILIIDTNYFSNDFAGELCAYCTGFDSENNTSEDMADLFYEDMNIVHPTVKEKIDDNPFLDYIMDKMDNEGDRKSTRLNSSH